jgi:hypothetical protein
MSQYQVLSLTQLKRSVRRAILGKVEHAGMRFIVTDYGEAVAELGPLSASAERFLAQLQDAHDETPDGRSRPVNPFRQAEPDLPEAPRRLSGA